MKKKFISCLTIILLVFSFAIFFSGNALAYIDPSVMTYAIQAIAGVVIAIGAVVGIYFRKAKKKISKKLGIDENRNKEVEKDEIIVKNKNEK